ncbi:MAG: hypothetical protein OXT67_12435 [Zetaproteobacteria bacterium]|nr:hypothetical protein [Zetaproteobacteria bacterium]
MAKVGKIIKSLETQVTPDSQRFRHPVELEHAQTEMVSTPNMEGRLREDTLVTARFTTDAHNQLPSELFRIYVYKGADTHNWEAQINPLARSLDERMPAIPAYIQQHPALQWNHKIIESLEGSSFFVAYAQRHDKELDLLFRRKAAARELTRILAARDQIERQLDHEAKEKQYLDMLQARRHRYAKTHELNQERYIQFLESLEQSYQKSVESTRIRRELTLKYQLQRHEDFWQAVEANLKQTEKYTPVSGMNLQSLLSGLPYLENSYSTFFRRLALIKKNQIRFHDNNLIEHMAGNYAPIELASLLNIKFHRPTWLQTEDRLQLEEKWREYTNYLQESSEKLNLRYAEEKKYRTQQVEKRIEDFWQIWDHANRRLPFSLSSRAHNIQTLLGALRFQNPDIFVHAFRDVQDAEIMRYSNQLNEHVDRHYPIIGFEQLSTFNPSEYAHQLRITENATHAGEYAPLIMVRGRFTPRPNLVSSAAPHLLTDTGRPQRKPPEEHFLLHPFLEEVQHKKDSEWVNLNPWPQEKDEDTESDTLVGFVHASPDKLQGGNHTFSLEPEATNSEQTSSSTTLGFLMLYGPIHQSWANAHMPSSFEDYPSAQHNGTSFAPALTSQQVQASSEPHTFMDQDLILLQRMRNLKAPRVLTVSPYIIATAEEEIERSKVLKINHKSK